MKLTRICSVFVLVIIVYTSRQLYMISFRSVYIYRTQAEIYNNSLATDTNQVDTETNGTMFNDKVSWRSSFRQSTSNKIPENYTLKGVLSNKDKSTNVTKTVERNNRIRIGILIPTCTRKLKYPELKKLSLTTICLPSVYKTLEEKYAYHIYIGIDKGDYLESVQHNLTVSFDNLTVVVGPGNTFTKSVNSIARKAFDDGMDYLVRINDDTSFETKKWTSLALAVLLKYTPPNIGVVGPTCRQGHTGILTHDMVHRTHMTIFGSYYPVYFDNWWADDWITNVYKPRRSTKLTSWTVKHHLQAHGTRYNVDMKKVSRLKKIVSFDKGRLAKYLTKVK